MSKSFQGRVKAVLSGDSIVLVNPNHKAKSSPEERVVSLALIQAPRNEEPFAFESREYLRNLLIGKIVTVKVINVAPSGRNFVDISSPVFESLISEVVANGWAKVRERANDEEAELLKDLESNAKAENLGLWNSKAKHVEVLGSLPEAALEKSKTSPLRAIVERVLSGDRLKLRFLLDKTTHAEVLVHVAGIRAPVTAPFNDQAKYYVELFDLAKVVSVSVLGELSNGILIAKITDASGNLTDRLLKEGLAEVDDRQSVSIGSTGMSHLRQLLQSAKIGAKGQWAGIQQPKSVSNKSSDNGSEVKVGSKLTATVGRVISADTINLYLPNDEEVTVSLTSVRAPRQNDPATAPFVAAARDFVRKKAIGKKVTVNVEAIRPKSDNFDERPLVDIILPNNSSLSALIVESGWATVIRHRRDDTDRSAQWDLLLELEQSALKAKKGLHGKAPEAGKLVEASENKARAASFLHTFKNRTNISGVVEAVLNYNRFRIFIPRESTRLTLVLGGLANTSNSANDLSSKALSYVARKVTQRDVHINIYNNDNTGAFVGNLFLQGQGTPLQVVLLNQGLAKIHDYSVSQTGFENEFVEAQSKAQEEKLGYWANYDPSEVQDKEVEAVAQSTEALRITPKYLNAKVTFISEDGLIYLRTINGEKDDFKAFQNSFRAALGSSPQIKSSVKNGEIVAAKDSENGLYYRARVISHSKGTYEVQHVDYGVIDSVSSVVSLPQQFSISAYPAQAHSAKLSLIHLPPSQPQDYLSEAVDLIYELTQETEELVAVQNRTKPAPNIDFDVVLVDFSAIKKGADKNESINRELVRNGLAIVDRKITNFERALKSEYDTLIELQNEAKRQHIGCWQFGDIEEDEDL